MTAFAEAFAHASIQASLLVVLLLTGRRVLGDRIPPGVYCTGWALVSLRLLVPLALRTPLGVPKPLDGDLMLGVPLLESERVAVADGGPFHAGALDWTAVACMVWLAGACVVLAVYVSRSRVFARKIQGGKPANDETLLFAWHRASRRLAAGRFTNLAVTECVGVPTVVGVFRPRVLVPRHMVGRLTPSEWQDVLLHELAHVQRFDLLRDALWVAAIAVHWFNPLVWVAASCQRRDRELAADAVAVRQRVGDGVGYGRSLLRALEVATSSEPVPAPGAALGPREIRRRLLAVTSRPPSRAVRFTAAAGLGVLALATLSDPVWRTAVVPNAGFENERVFDGSPNGWFMSGYQRDQYRAKADPSVTHTGRLSARLEPLSPGFGRYATLMESLPAKQFRGHRIRVSAYLRGQGIDGRGDFWARLQAADSPPDGPGLGAGRCRLHGTFGWRRCELVLDVPASSVVLQFGAGLGANGTVWIDDATIEVL
ncbi:MAG: M56 family metallopeptidase [Nannocystaceae bacterium]|nr:M56 family metallopeptidase [Nannocystaceae bacterium]